MVSKDISQQQPVPPEKVIGSYTFTELGRALTVDANAPDWILSEPDPARKKSLQALFAGGLQAVTSEGAGELSYVQGLVARRNRVFDLLRQTLTARETAGITGSLKKTIGEAGFETRLVEAEMAGAQFGLEGKPSDYRALSIVTQALKGEEFRKAKSRDEFNLPRDEGAPLPELIIGTVILLWTKEGNERLIYVQQEKEAKPQFDKKPGDFSLVAGGRDWKRETIKQGADRELYEEGGLRLDDIARDPMPIGYFQFPPDKSRHEVEGPWVVAFSAYLSTKQSRQLAELPQDEEVISKDEVSPRDGQTFNAGWKKPEEIMNKVAVRGAMLGIIEAWSNGETRVIRPTSPGRR